MSSKKYLSFLANPVFEDEDKTRIAGLLNIVSLVFGVVTLLGGISIVGTDFSLDIALLVVFLLSLTVLVQYLMRRGYVRGGSITLFALLWCILAYLNVGSGGVRAYTYGSFALVVLMAGLLVSGRVGIIIAVVSTAMGGLLIWLEDNTTLIEPGLEYVDRISAMVAQSALFFLSAGMIYAASRGIQGALRKARESNQKLQLAQESLQEKITAEREHRREMERLMHREQEQRESLQRLIARIRDAASNLSSAAAEILAATTQQASGASEQSAAIAQASTTIDEVRTIAEQSAQRAQTVANLAQQVAQISQVGQQAVSDTVAGMQEVQEKADSIARDVLVLSDQAQAIGSIIATVAQIASQSKMLALNASVEAARAGEAGAGFSVVAQEVRSLAAQSRAATEQVRDLLTEIQHGVNTAVIAAEEGIKGAAGGVQLTQRAGKSIDQLAENVTTSTQAAQQIAAASGQQVSGVEQIATAMESIHQITAQNVAGARQVEKAAQELKQLAGLLLDLVEQYQAVDD